MNFIFTNKILNVRLYPMRWWALLVVISWLNSGCRSYTASQILKEEAINYQQQGRIAQEKNDWDSAISYYKKASYLDPYNPRIINDLGIAYEKKRAYQLAERSYKRAIELDKYFLPAYYNLGRLYEKLGDIPSALKYYKMRIKLSQDENDPWAWKARQKILFYEEKGIGTIER